MLDQFAWTCSLSQAAAIDALITIHDVDDAAQPSADNAARLATLGAINYRALRYAEAQQHFEHALAAVAEDRASAATSSYSQIMLAMTKSQLKEVDEARRLLAEVRPAVEEAMISSPDATQRATLALLSTEAHRLIQSDVASSK